MHKRFFVTFVLIGSALILLGSGCLSLGGGSVSKTSGPAGIFLSVNKGNTWKSISLFPTISGVKSLSGVSVYNLIQDPQTPSTLYWFSRRHGLFFTIDAGRSWQHAPAPLNTGFIYSVIVHPQDSCTIYVTNGSQIYKSVDCARSWNSVFQELRPGIKIVSLTFNPNPPYQIFAAEDNGDILQTVDLGQSWSVLYRLRITIARIQADPLQQHVFYVASRSSGLYRSINDGRTWTSLAKTMKDYPKALNYRRMYLHPKKPGVIYWISTYGLMVSTDSGNTLNPINLITPPGSANIYAFAINPRNDNEMYYTATINNHSNMYRSVDGGVTWNTKALPSGQIPTFLWVHPKNGNLVYLGFTIPSGQ